MSVRIPSARLSVPSGILKMTHQRQHLRGRRAYLSEGGPIYRLKMRRMDHTKFGVIFLVQLSGGHTGGASGAVHQGPRPLGAHQRGPDSNLFEKFLLFLTLPVTVATAKRSFSKLK